MTSPRPHIRNRFVLLGDIALTIDPPEPTQFTLRLRLPGWCAKASVAVNGTSVDVAQAEKGYLAITRKWTAGDVVRLNFDMPVERLYAHPQASEDAGRVTLKRGPVVYCVEEADLGFAPQLLTLPADAAIAAAFDADLLGGAVRLSATAARTSEAGWTTGLYRRERPVTEAASLVAIPYHLWANRDAGAMLVWLPQE